MPDAGSASRKAGLLRVLSQKSVWREVWLSVKRVHKDRRARRRLGYLSLGIGILLLLGVLGIAYAMWFIGSGGILLLPLLMPLWWWRRRRALKESQPMHVTPQAPAPDPRVEAARQAALRSYFADLALLYAVLVDRAGSERFLKEKELPPGVEVTSRRVHVETFRSADLWPRIAVRDREAIMVPDGGWDWDHINRFAMGIEPLRLLRWVLRIDFRLPTVGQQLSGDFGIAHEIVTDPPRLRRGRDLIDAETVRASRDDAQTTLMRCVAEAISRGYQPPADEQTAAWARLVSDELAGNQNEDFLLGENLVSEASREQLGWATALANIRTDFLSMVSDLLEGGSVPEDPLASIFAAEDESVAEAM